MISTLTVLYDPACELCRRAYGWAWEQPKHIPVHFTAAGSSRARRRFPELNVHDTLTQITAIDNHGNVFRGANAWIVILWALKRYRGWSLQLAAPHMRPLAKRIIDTISRNRKSTTLARVLLPGVKPPPAPSEVCDACGTPPA